MGVSLLLRKFMTNHLENSTSPYLLQHATNPVNWYPWGKEAIEKARQEDKPIFLSIGYAACHWCHVMAHESFEDPAIAAIMNRNYINIKVDREERPDLDSIYMSAVVALTGQGGWPMSVFLTPNLTPFYGGTYFPPDSRYGLPSFKDILVSLSTAWQRKRDEVVLSGQKMMTAIKQKSVRAGFSGTFTQDSLSQAARTLVTKYDWNHGGWGIAPKFPQPMALEFLLRRHIAGDKDALKPVLHALRAMAKGGMYDILGGGFSRYATDNKWLVPHFEKMLYDNALLARVYLHAWQITREPLFRRVVKETLNFISREMLAPQGGFYSSLDADSEGKEGKYYVWTLEEIRNAFGDKDELFETAFDISSTGNWEGKIVLQRVTEDIELSSILNLSISEVLRTLESRKLQLFALRNKRTRPGTDDKILTSWNGLMLSTFAEAARVLKSEVYLQIAQKNAHFLLSALRADGKLHRAWRNGQVSEQVFLEDYASLILGLIDLYQSDFNNQWYNQACTLTTEMIVQFSDPAGGFFDTPDQAETVLLRPKEIQDNATPSGNALAVEALLKMAAFSENEAWLQLAEKSLALVAGTCSDYPTAFSRWLSVADSYVNKTRQIVIIGNPTGIDSKSFLQEISKNYRPNTITAASSHPIQKGSPQLLSDRPMIAEKTTIYICEGFVCKKPLTTLNEFKKQLLE